MRYSLIRKSLILGIIVLFIGVAVAPGISAEEPTVIPKVLRVWMPGITEDDYSIQIEVTQEQLDEVNNTVEDVVDSIEAAMGENSPEGEDVTAWEWEEIRQSAYVVIDLFKELIGDDFPDDDAKNTICSVIGDLLGSLRWLRQPVFSIGFGITWVPFYDYETFIGKLLRPIWIKHFLGTSISLRINPYPPAVPYGKSGNHIIRSLLYTGILINFGALGINRLIGPQLLIGYGFNGMA